MQASTRAKPNTNVPVWLLLAGTAATVAWLANQTYADFSDGVPYYVGYWLSMLVFGGIASLAFNSAKYSRPVIALSIALGALVAFNAQEVVTSIERRASEEDIKEAQTILRAVSTQDGYRDALLKDSENSFLILLNSLFEASETSIEKITALSESISPPALNEPIAYDSASATLIAMHLDLYEQSARLADEARSKTKLILEEERQKSSEAIESSGYPEEFKVAALNGLSERLTDYGVFFDELYRIFSERAETYAKFLEILRNEHGHFKLDSKGVWRFENLNVLPRVNELLESISTTDEQLFDQVKVGEDLDARYLEGRDKLLQGNFE